MLRFSVIIPIYNAAETLAETLQSVLHQSNTDFEIVAVNDGSTDNSAAIFSEMTADFERAILINQENGGLGNARNRAAENARGEWLVFLDADDYWSANKLALLEKSILENERTEFIYHPVFEMDQSGKMRVRKMRAVNTVDEFLELGNPFVPSAVAIKRSVFTEAGGFIEDKRVLGVEDLLLWLRSFQRGTIFQEIDLALTVYRLAFGMTANLEDHLNKVQHAMRICLDEKILTENQVTVFMNRKNYEAARQLHKQGNFKEALAFYKKHLGGGLKEFLLASLCKLGIAV